jgi:hypothetical protein
VLSRIENLTELSAAAVSGFDNWTAIASASVNKAATNPRIFISAFYPFLSRAELTLCLRSEISEALSGEMSSPDLEAVCRKTLQQVNRDSRTQSPAPKIPSKTICKTKSEAAPAAKG